MDGDAARECLTRGDALMKAGAVAAAIDEYLAFAGWAEAAGFTLKAVAVRKRVLRGFASEVRRPVVARRHDGDVGLRLRLISREDRLSPDLKDRAGALWSRARPRLR